MKKLLALIMALCMMLVLCACGDNEIRTADNIDNDIQSSQTETSSKEETTPKFEVTVVDQNGDAVSGIWVQLCNESCVPKATDENGVATFDAEITDGYKLSVMTCPDGYETEYVGDNYIYLEEGITEYTFEITKK